MWPRTNGESPDPSLYEGRAKANDIFVHFILSRAHAISHTKFHAFPISSHPIVHRCRARLLCRARFVQATHRHTQTPHDTPSAHTKVRPPRRPSSQRVPIRRARTTDHTSSAACAGVDRRRWRGQNRSPPPHRRPAAWSVRPSPPRPRSRRRVVRCCCCCCCGPVALQSLAHRQIRPSPMLSSWQAWRATPAARLSTTRAPRPTSPQPAVAPAASRPRAWRA